MGRQASGLKGKGLTDSIGWLFATGYIVLYVRSATYKVRVTDIKLNYNSFARAVCRPRQEVFKRMPDNLILATLPKDEGARLDQFLTRVELETGYVLIEPNEPIENIYFPIDAITSTLQEMSDGSSIESGLMGVEGCISIQLRLRSETPPSRTLIQVSGRLIHTKAADFIREIGDNPASPLNKYIALYTHDFLNMTSPPPPAIACTRLTSGFVVGSN